jgi:enterochelin esterase family protein
VNFILDNLIAEKKAVPMIIVMEDGGISQGMGGGGGPGRRGGGPNRGSGPASAPAGGRALAPSPDGETFFAAAPAAAPAGRAGRGRGRGGPGGMTMPFTSQLVNDVIPEIDAAFRTIPDRDHRAMAGLSLGGTQTYQITAANKDKFAYVGIFSAPFGFPGLNAYAPSAEEFDKQYKVFFISMGGKEGGSSGRDPANQLKQAGVTHVTYYEAPGTAHEFQTWRKALHEFAPLLFQN